jgi:hypothetical protein
MYTIKSVHVTDMERNGGANDRLKLSSFPLAQRALGRKYLSRSVPLALSLRHSTIPYFEESFGGGLAR